MRSLIFAPVQTAIPDAVMIREDNIRDVVPSVEGGERSAAGYVNYFFIYPRISPLLAARQVLRPIHLFALWFSCQFSERTPWQRSVSSFERPALPSILPYTRLLDLQSWWSFMSTTGGT